MALPRTRSWRKSLPDGFEIHKELQTLLGQVISFSVVLIKDKEGITRYDTVHHYVHRDVLGRETAPKVIDKIWYPRMTFKEGFDYADDDLSENYKEYYAYYESH
jgi:hypothetical protein